LNLPYLLPRIMRHFMPESVARFLLKQRWIIRPGLESSDPVAAVTRYVEVLSRRGRSIKGQRVLVFGYGGRFAVGVELLKQGAAHVVLCDHFVLLDTERNLQLLPQYGDCLFVEGGDVKPLPQFITLLHGDIREASIQSQISPVDYVLSTSVYEHLDDVDGVTHALASLTKPDGLHLHFVDLQDHFFKYPFEMLTFSEHVWKSFLNPTSNLNRLRLPDYRKIFGGWFEKVDILVLEQNEDEFRAVCARIQPEFITGNEAEDSTTLIQVVAQNPSRKK
jgi:hypothetical protein